MKRILVPIDFSKSSENAAILAAKIGKKSKSSIYLLHMIELPTGIVDMGAGSNFSIPESMLYLRKIKEKIIDFRNTFFSKKMEVFYAMKFLNPTEGILKYSEKINPDLIIMGSKGQSNFEEILIGSNTEKVVRTSNIPVIVAKNNTKIGIKNLVFASGFEKKNEKVILEKVKAFSVDFGCKIHLLKVNTPANFESTFKATKAIKDYIKEIELPKYTINVYNDTSIEKGIMHFSQEIDADIIALATHGRSGIAHLFTSSVTKNLSKNALRPVLTVKL